MDMAVANLLKHKIRFELVDEHFDYEELRCYSIGRQYRSRELESLNSVGALSSVNLSLDHLTSFDVHILSSMIRECPFAITRAKIKPSIILNGGTHRERHLLGYTFDNPRNNLHLFSR